jgi:hypothetical protein
MATGVTRIIKMQVMATIIKVRVMIKGLVAATIVINSD